MNICVFGSSSKSTNKVFIDESFKLGELIAQYNYICVNGGGRYGCMGGLNNGCHSKGGKIVGIIHKQFCVDASEHPTIKDLVVVDGNDLYKRKLELFNNADCLLVLPGGVGTFDEFFDGVSAKSLGMKDMSQKPICLININGFYDGFILQIHRAYEEGILYHSLEDYFHVESNVTDAFQWCIKELSQLQNIDSEKHNKLTFNRVVSRYLNIDTTDNNMKTMSKKYNIVSTNDDDNSNKCYQLNQVYYIPFIIAFTMGLIVGFYYNKL